MSCAELKKPIQSRRDLKRQPLPFDDVDEENVHLHFSFICVTKLHVRLLFWSFQGGN